MAILRDRRAAAILQSQWAAFTRQKPRWVYVAATARLVADIIERRVERTSLRHQDEASEAAFWRLVGDLLSAASEMLPSELLDTLARRQASSH